MSATLIQNCMPSGPLRRSSPQLFTSEEEQVFQIQHITLHRPKDGKGLGFTIRGGVEHGLGHFVSAIERGSEAHLQGLRPGDQILAVDGMLLTGATHREVVTLISSRWTLEISVKSTGVIPIKDRVGDPITWHNIAVRPEPPTNDVMKHLHTIPIESHVESRVVISITGSQGLGCSICKGPSSKPGIYIQSTKPGGLARQVGLRPGDQILDCNGISFQRLEFNEAVYHLKSSRHLDLLIRKGAGADLFPSESSGYDSSSSSSMGDSRPNPYRASVVIDTAKLSKSASDLSMSAKPTAVFTNRLRLEERVIEEERKKLEEEQERLKREAWRLEAEKKRFEEEKKLTTNKTKAKSSPNLNDSIESSTESTLSGGLAAQIQNELQRRAQKTAVTSTPALSEVSIASVPLPPPPPKIPPQSNTNTMQKKAIQKEKTLANLKNDKHDALMEEFKRAHRRMFNSSTEEDEEHQPHQPALRVIEDMNQMKEDTEYETQAIVTSVAVALMPQPQEIKAVVKKEISFAPEPKSTTGDAASLQSSSITTTTTTTNASKSYCSDDTLSGSCSCSNTMSSSNPSNSSSCEESETTLSYIESEKPAQSITAPFPPERSSSISPETTHSQPKTASMLKKKKVLLSSFKPPLARKGHFKSPGIPTPDYDSTPERSPKSFKKRRYQNSNLSRYRSNSMSSLLEAAPPTAPSLRETTLRRLAPRLSPAKSVPDLMERPTSRLEATSGRQGGHASSGRGLAHPHPDVGDIGSLDSFSINDSTPRGDPKPPAHYFESQANKNTNTVVTMRSYLPERPEQIRFEFLPQPSHNKSVRFNVGEEAMIAAQDYRVANASRKPHMKTLEQRQIMTKVSPRTRASPRSSPSPSSHLTVSSDDEPARFQRNGPLRKSRGPLTMARASEPLKKKSQAPPPPSSGQSNQMKKQELKI